jgi:hypothetical protein
LTKIPDDRIHIALLHKLGAMVLSVDLLMRVESKTRPLRRSSMFSIPAYSTLLYSKIYGHHTMFLVHTIERGFNL